MWTAQVWMWLFIRDIHQGSSHEQPERGCKEKGVFKRHCTEIQRQVS